MKIILFIFLILFIISIAMALLSEILKTIKEKRSHNEYIRQQQEKAREERCKISTYEQEFRVSKFVDEVYYNIMKITGTETDRVIVESFEVQIFKKKMGYCDFPIPLTFKEIGYENLKSKEEVIAFSKVLSEKFGSNYVWRWIDNGDWPDHILICEKSVLTPPPLKPTH